jgi:hypothetical protein
MKLTAAEAEDLFEQGGESLGVLIQSAHESWPATDDELEPQHAEVARYTRVAAYRLLTEGRDEWQTVNLWQQRHIAAASITGNTRSLSLSLQQQLYLLAQHGHFAAAHVVLDAMAALGARSSVPSAAPPTEDLFQRILVERRALLLRMEGRSEESIGWYEQAHRLTESGTRGEAKVRGGLEVAKWLAAGPHDEAVAAFSRLVADSVRWPDVHTNATRNLEAARVGDRSAAVPFDLL